jgi:hypothetical protein
LKLKNIYWADFNAYSVAIAFTPVNFNLRHLNSSQRYP